MKPGFLDKLIARIDRVDPKSLQAHFLRIVQERGLLETIFQSIQEGVVVVDGMGRLEYANRAAEHLLGFSFEAVRGRPVAAYLRDIEWDRILRLDPSEWSRLISHEIEVACPERRFVSFYIVPLASPAAGEQGAMLMLRDVTHDRLHEAALIETERFNAIKLLAAGVAHEVGNPLNALGIHLQLLDRRIRALPSPEAEALRELVAVARNEVGRLDLIISQFLRAIRPSKPKFTLAQVLSLLKESLVLLKQEVQDRQIEVQIESRETLPRIRVDRDQIKQVFFNLIRNAFQAMPHGGMLTIALSATDRFLSIAFQDTGRGIRPKDFSRIFDPYYTTKPGGSGLGLMIVQRIVQEHAGQIKVASTPAHGTTFTVLLPLAERRVRLLKAPPAGERPSGIAAASH